MTPTVVNSEPLLSKLIGDLRELFREHHYLRVSVKTGKDRTLDQNAISHAWYKQVSRELREQTALEVKRESKLNCGVPIMRAEDADFREFYDAAIKPHLSYEQKLKAMDFVPLTSIMVVSQLSQYLVAMQAFYKPRGVVLEFPPEDDNQKR